jgi:hypothetical protein
MWFTIHQHDALENVAHMITLHVEQSYIQLQAHIRL